MPLKIVTQNVKGMKSADVENAWWGGKVIHDIAVSRASQTLDRVRPFLEGRVLDIGMGAGTLNHLMSLEGYEVEGVDVENMSLYEDIKPVIYNGNDLPFGDGTFDVALIALVLHHCENPLQVLSEARRVAKRVVVVEDTFDNWLEYRWLEIYDAVMNMEFYKHEYHSVEEWKEIVEKYGWTMVKFEEWQQISYGLQYGRYCLMVIE